MAAFIATNRIRARWFFDLNSHGPWEYWNHNVPAMNIIRVLRQYNPKSIGRRRINLTPSALSLMFKRGRGGGCVEGRAIEFGWITMIRYSEFFTIEPSTSLSFRWMDRSFIYFLLVANRNGKNFNKGEGLINRSDRSEWIWNKIIKKGEEGNFKWSKI